MLRGQTHYRFLIEIKTHIKTHTYTHSLVQTHLLFYEWLTGWLAPLHRALCSTYYIIECSPLNFNFNFNYTLQHRVLHITNAIITFSFEREMNMQIWRDYLEWAAINWFTIKSYAISTRNDALAMHHTYTYVAAENTFNLNGDLRCRGLNLFLSMQSRQTTCLNSVDFAYDR